MSYGPLFVLGKEKGHPGLFSEGRHLKLSSYLYDTQWKKDDAPIRNQVAMRVKCWAAKNGQKTLKKGSGFLVKSE